MDTPSIPQKRCTKCGELKPATTDYFPIAKNRKGEPSRLSSWCKGCFTKKAIEWARNHVEQRKEYQREYRINNRDRLVRQRHQYYLQHHLHIKLRVKQWGQSHIVQVRTNRRCSYAKYNAKKHSLPFGFNQEDRKRMLEYWDYSCCICGQREDFWHILADDHWIAINDPRPDNPGTVSWNMLPMCHATKGSNGQGACNQSKFNNDGEIWLVSKFGKRKAKQILDRINAYFEWVKAQDRE